MTAQRPFAILAALFAVIVVVVVACSPASGALGTVPPAPSAAAPSVDLGSPDATPQPSDVPNEQPTALPSGATGSPAPSAAAGTTLVRAYLYLGGGQGSAGLVAVLRTVPATKAVATAAVTAALAGPTAGETARSMSTAIPAGSQLLDLSIANGVATVNQSSEFESGGGSASVLTRLGQVVYTVTQFPSVKSVQFQIEGWAANAFSGQGVVLDKPVGRADYVQLLPAIWVDRPAYGAAIGNPTHVTGSANVFEATFRIAILDGGGKVLADEQAMATCGSGCRGTFDTSVPYTVARAQYGTLRVYEPSAKDGTPMNVRDYRVWLTPNS
jgi:germination protein M